jgi:hypothetical protein
MSLRFTAAVLSPTMHWNHLEICENHQQHGTVEQFGGISEQFTGGLHAWPEHCLRRQIQNQAGDYMTSCLDLQITKVSPPLGKLSGSVLPTSENYYTAIPSLCLSASPAPKFCEGNSHSASTCVPVCTQRP